MLVSICFLTFSPKYWDKRGDRDTINLTTKERFFLKKNVYKEKILWFHIIGWVLQSIGWQRREQASLSGGTRELGLENIREAFLEETTADLGLEKWIHQADKVDKASSGMNKQQAQGMET